MSNNKYKLTIGADPEFFLVDKKTNKVVPACGLFGGAKGSPIFLSPDGGFLEDGAAVEFNVTPCDSLAEVKTKINDLILVFLNNHANYTIHGASSAEFDLADIKKYPKAMQIGCAADLFAYGVRVAPSVAAFKANRFAGGHIHIGIDPWPEGLQKETLVKALDFVWMQDESKYLSDPYRWKFYGHPGLYRDTDYGVEYRSPDNWWCNPSAEWSPKAKEHVAKVETRFSTFCTYLMGILNHDKTGARLEHDIQRSVKESNASFYLTSSTIPVLDVYAGNRGWGIEFLQRMISSFEGRIREKMNKEAASW